MAEGINISKMYIKEFMKINRKYGDFPLDGLLGTDVGYKIHTSRLQ